MTQFDHLDPVDQLRYYLTLQLEAFYEADWQRHDALAEKIDIVAKLI